MQTELQQRRRLIKGICSASLLPWLAAGLLKPQAVIAAEWNRAAFSARNINDALKAYGLPLNGESRDIVINGPEIAENGAKVELEITSNLANTKSIAVFADKNPMPLCAEISFFGNCLPFARVQLKLAETTRVRAIVKTHDGKSWVASREVKVTLGGCGG